MIPATISKSASRPTALDTPVIVDIGEQGLTTSKNERINEKWAKKIKENSEKNENMSELTENISKQTEKPSEQNEKANERTEAENGQEMTQNHQIRY